MKIVRIQALPRPGFPTRPRAGRFFPSGEPVTMEIVDQDKDPTVEVLKTDSNGKSYKHEVPDPSRMSRKVFETMILTDDVLRVLADGETISVLSQAALDAARKQAVDLQGKLTDAEVAKAELGDKLAGAQAEVAALKTRVAELAPALEGAKGGGGGEPPTPDPHPSGKGGKAR